MLLEKPSPVWNVESNVPSEFNLAKFFILFPLNSVKLPPTNNLPSGLLFIDLTSPLKPTPELKVPVNPLERNNETIPPLV